MLACMVRMSHNTLRDRAHDLPISHEEDHQRGECAQRCTERCPDIPQTRGGQIIRPQPLSEPNEPPGLPRLAPCVPPRLTPPQVAPHPPLRLPAEQRISRPRQSLDAPSRPHPSDAPILHLSLCTPGVCRLALPADGECHGHSHWSLAQDSAHTLRLGLLPRRQRRLDVADIRRSAMHVQEAHIDRTQCGRPGHGAAA